MKAPSEEICGKSTQGRNIMLKYTFTGFQRSNNRPTGLSSFVYQLLPHKSAKFPEIFLKFELIAVQGHPRSSILVSIGSAYSTSYLSLIVTMDVSPIVFEILTFKARKWLVSHP